MHQRSLASFFGSKAPAPATTAEGPTTAQENRKRPRSGEESDNTHATKAPSGPCTGGDSAPHTGDVTRVAPLAPSNAASSAFHEHEAEYRTLLAAVETPTATSMAKLFQDDDYDPCGCDGRLNAVWPLAGVTAGTKSRSSGVPYAAVVDTLVDISATGSRLECVKLLTQLLWTVMARDPDDLIPVIYLAINKQAPQHEGVELGIGDALLVKVVAECCGMTEARAKEEYRNSGDLAEIAQNNKQKQSTLVTPKPLQARTVYNAFVEIATMSGKDVMRRRADIIKRLLRDAQGPETNLIVRALQQKMRIGLAEPSALAAVGYAFALNFLGRQQVQKESLTDLQKLLNVAAGSFARIFYAVPSLEVVVRAVQNDGFMVLIPGSETELRHKRDLSIRPGLPVKPQLAHPTSGITVILDRLQGKRFTSEYKYDGERAQIHYQEGKGFQIFSRNSETHTGKYPDVISMLPGVFDKSSVHSFIIDSEVVAVNPETGALQAFQVLQHRGRKNIEEKDVAIPVCVFAFDVLYLNGESTLELTLEERRRKLWSHFTPLHGKMAFATHLDSDNVEDIQKFLDQSIADGCEGLMIKTLEEEANYTPAKRSHYWLKLKKDYMDGVTDTLDLVPIGAYFGKGKRTGVFGGFLLACYDAENDEWQSICKIGTGFQDDELESLTAALKPFVLSAKPGYYHTTDEADAWLAAAQVWEVKAADLSISPVHYAAIGLVDANRGIALRFPRYIRTRDDKKPVDCTSANQVAEMYKAQSLAIKPPEELEEE